ncbi:MAG: PxKF domain-containing protein [Actinobacteria bacterium]|nr:PxKF domain-containing protein [Actinomycetota bacterium]
MAGSKAAGSRFTITRRLRAVSIFVLVAFVASISLAPLPGAEAHGYVDQKVSGSTVCNASNFKGFVVTASALRQEFVPSRSGIVGVDLCLNVLTPAVGFTLNIRTGTAASPGGTIGTKLIPNESSGGVQWIHVDFDSQVGTVAGTKYVLEIPPTQATFQWLTTCGTTAIACSAADTDRYPAGTSNFSGNGPGQLGPKADFAFQTYSGQPASITGTIAGPAVVCEGTTDASVLTAKVKNLGAGVSAFNVKASIVDKNNVERTIATTTVSSLGANEEKPVSFGTAKIPALTAEGRATLKLTVDPDQAVLTAPFIATAPTAAFCGTAQISNLSLTTDTSSVAAGSYRVPLESIPVENIGFSAPGVESAGLRTFGLRTFGLRTFDPQSAGLRTFGLRTFLGGSAEQNALDKIYLSEVPVNGGWGPKLPSDLANVPLQNISLWDILSHNPVVEVSAADIDFAHSPLRGLTLAGMLSAGAPLTAFGAQVPTDPPMSWCAFFANQSYSCSDYGISSSSSLIDAELAGIHASIPWSAFRFASMDLNALAATPLFKLVLQDYQISQTPLRSFTTADLASPNTFLDACSTCTTLGDYEAAGKIKLGPLFGDLIANLVNKTANGPLGQTTLGDYMRGALASPEDFPVGILGLDQAPLYPGAGTGVLVHNTLTLTAGSGTGKTTVVDPQISVVPPPGFLLKAGTSVATYNGQAVAGLAEPSPAGGKLTWTVPALVAPGTSLTLKYDLAPGLTLQTAGSVLSAHASYASPTDGRPADASFGPVQNVAPVQVVDTETLPGQANNNPESAPLLERGVKRIGFVSSNSDYDFYRIPVPRGPSCDISGSAAALAMPVEPGCRIAVHMEMLSNDQPLDYDLALYGQSQTEDAEGAGLRTFGLRTFGLRTFPVTDESNDVNSTSNSVPETLQDFGLRTFGLRTFSATRGSSDEIADVVSQSGDSGYYTLQAFGFNGDQGPRPYVLGTVVSPPPSLGPCPARTFPFGNASAGATSGSIPSDTKTLILFNQKRMTDLYGDANGQVTQLAQDLATYASRAEVGGFVYNVAADSQTSAVLAAWDASPCDVAKANAVAGALRDIVHSAALAAPDTFANVVIVGDDEIAPSIRVPDRTPASNEQDFYSAIDLATGPNNNALTNAAASRFYLSDDGFGTDQTADANGHPVYVPKWAVGRLVETPTQIHTQLQNYFTSDGILEAPGSSQTALVAGYDFVRDGATAIADGLAQRLPTGNVGRLTCAADSWSKDDLVNDIVGPLTSSTCASPNPLPAPQPDIVSFNGHADQYRFLPAICNTNPVNCNLLTTADTGWANLQGRKIIFSVGCHLGLNIADTLNASPTGDQSARLQDWAELFGSKAALLVANSGFGYGDTDTVAFSERLMTLFAQNLDSARSAGEALRDAKRSYFLSYMGAYGAYDEKALQEAILYGIPTFRAEASGVQANGAFVSADATPALITDPITGMLVRPFDSGAIGYTAHATANGTYYSVGSDGIMVQNQRPIVPQSGYEIARDPAGNHAVGFYLTSMDAQVVANNDPVGGRAEVGNSRGETSSIGVWPAAPGVVSSVPGLKGGTDQQLLLWGRFNSTSPAGAKPLLGDLLLPSNVRGSLYFSNTDAPTARVLQITGQTVNNSSTALHVEVRVSDDGVTRAGVFVGGHYVELSKLGGLRWGANTTVTDASSPGPILAEIVNAGGVAYGALKGGPLRSFTGQQDAAINISVAPAAINGWIKGAANVSATLNNGANFPLESSLDGSEFAAYTPGTAVTVTDTGEHTFAVRGYDAIAGRLISASRAFLVDGAAPTIRLVTPAADGSSTFTLNQVGAPDAICDDQGSGVALCDTSAPVVTNTPGDHTYSASVTDYAGNTTSVTVHYTVLQDLTPPTQSVGSPTAGQHFDQNSTATASWTCSDQGGSEVASCDGTQDGSIRITNGGSLDTSTYGDHTLTVTATDGSNNTSSTTVHFFIDDKTAPSITITKPASNASYEINSSQLANYSCQDNAGGSGLAAPPDGCKGTVANGAAFDTSTLGSHGFTVSSKDAANPANPAALTVNYTVVDTGAPTISASLNPSAANNTYTQGASVTLTYACADSGSGIKSTGGCTAKYTDTNAALGASPASVDTSTPGTRTIRVTATDNGDNSTTQDVTYTVKAGYGFDGFYSPIMNPGTNNTYNVVQAGNSAPFKFRVYDSSGNEVTSTSSTLWPATSFQWQQITCGAPVTSSTCGSVSPSGTATNATSNPAFRYDTSNHQYVFTAQTLKTYAGKYYEFILTLPDGTKKYAYLKFTK